MDEEQHHVIHYFYSAGNSEGKVLHGEIHALNKDDMILQLRKQGLFLISWHTSEESQEFQVSVPASEPPPPGIPEERIPDAPVVPKITTRQKICLTLLLLSGVGFGLGQAWIQGHPPETAGELNGRISRLHRGMTRPEVERIFPVSLPKCSTVQKGCYSVLPNFIVEIPYSAGTSSAPQKQPVYHGDLKISRTVALHER